MKWSIFSLTIRLITFCSNEWRKSSALAFAPPQIVNSIQRHGTNPTSYPKYVTIYASPHSEDDEIPGDAVINSTSLQSTESKPDDNEEISILQRFLSPKIDDPGLPLTEVLLAQIVAPSFQIFWVFAAHAPSPSWLRPLGSYFGEAPELAPRGSLLAPTLIHGAGLAVCWLAGALASKFYEKESFTLKEVKSGSVWERIKSYDTVVSRLAQAGAFATGILVLSTQLDLLLEFKRNVQFGESEETDLRLLIATVEVINDVVFEAFVLSSWRIIHAGFMNNIDNRSKRW